MSEYWWVIRESAALILVYLMVLYIRSQSLCVCIHYRQLLKQTDQSGRQQVNLNNLHSIARYKLLLLLRWHFRPFKHKKPE